MNLLSHARTFMCILSYVCVDMYMLCKMRTYAGVHNHSRCIHTHFEVEPSWRISSEMAMCVVAKDHACCLSQRQIQAQLHTTWLHAPATHYSDES